VISFIQMLVTLSTPNAPFGVSMLHPLLIIQGYNHNYMKYKHVIKHILETFIYLFCILHIIFYFH